MKKKCLLLLSCVVVVTFATAQPIAEKSFQAYAGMKGIKKKLSELKQSATQNLVNREQRELQQQAIEEKEEKLRFRMDKLKKFKEKQERQKQNATSMTEEQNELSGTQPAISVAEGSTQEIWSNFLASTFGESPIGWPPDPNGDVGPSQAAVITNGSLKVFEKRGVTDPPLVTTKGVSNKPAPAQFFIPLDDFFSPLFRRQSAATSDPHIHYDRLTKRWYVVAIEVNFSFENNLIFLAVSDGDQITDETSFTFYSFPSVQFPVSPKIQFQPFLDFPMLGVDKTAVLIGGNSFFFDENLNADSLYFVGYILDKKRLLRGDLVVYTTILGKISATSAGGLIVPQAVQNGDAQAPGSFFAGINYDLNGIAIAAVGYNSKNQPVSLKRMVVPVQQWNFPRDITAPGSPMPIDPLDTRLFEATIHKNKITGQSSLWTAHAIGVNQSGNFVSDENFNQQARTASRWYEIGDIYKNPGLNQVGTLYDPKPSGRRATMYFNPTIAASGQGHAVLGGTTAAFNEYLNVFVAGRYNEDAPNTLRKPERATKTTAIYAPFDRFLGYVGRWGDFSQTVVDPLDDQTIWTFQEYANADDSYGTRAVQLKAPPPATPQSIKALSNKSNHTVVITGTSENHSGFFDPGNDPGGPGYDRLTVKSTNGIVVGNVRLLKPTAIRCRIFTKDKAPGKYQLIITNPDGQFVVLEYTIEAESETTRSTVVTVNKEIASRYLASSAVYPNPTGGNFNLVINAAKDMAARIVVTDISGRQFSVKTQNLGKGNNTVPLSLANGNKGAYTVTVYNANNVVIAAHRVVKE